jgi:hypothetical protein
MQNKQPEKLSDGMFGASTVDLVRHSLTVVVGIFLSRLLKRNLLTNDEVSLLLGFVPSVLFSVGFALWKRWETRKNIATALKMPENSTVAQLKAVLSSTEPVEVLSANPESVVVRKEVEKEEVKS